MNYGQIVASGSFTSDGTAKEIPLRSDFDFFETTNYTQMATTQTPGRGVKFTWNRGLADGYGFMVSKEDAADTVTYEVVTSGAFTRVDKSVKTPEAAKSTSGTDVTNADPAVVTVTAHGYSTGDRIRIYGTTSMLQIAGYEFTITRVDANSFQLPYLDASGFAAAATAGTVRRIPNNPSYVPEKNYITKATQASSMVVTLSLTHNLAVGDKVRLHVDSNYGMTQADGLVGEVTAVDTTNNTITLDIDSSAFDAFAFPISAVAAGGVTPAHIVPFGTVANGVDQALVNQDQIVMKLGAGADGPAGSSSDVIYWRAWKAGFVNNE